MNSICSSRGARSLDMLISIISAPKIETRGRLLPSVCRQEPMYEKIGEIKISHRRHSLQITMVLIRPYVLIKLAYPKTLLSTGAISSVEDGYNKIRPGDCYQTEILQLNDCKH